MEAGGNNDNDDYDDDDGDDDDDEEDVSVEDLNENISGTIEIEMDDGKVAWSE